MLFTTSIADPLCAVAPPGPVKGMGVARQVGTIGYRSREEFDARFSWTPEKPGRPFVRGDVPRRPSAVDPECDEPGRWQYDDEEGHTFEIERYLQHAAHKFVGGTGIKPYDPNCYLTLSKVTRQI